MRSSSKQIREYNQLVLGTFCYLIKHKGKYYARLGVAQPTIWRFSHGYNRSL